MAEVSGKTKTRYKQNSPDHTGPGIFTVLQVVVAFLLMNSTAAMGVGTRQVQVEKASQSDLSVPLWGGAAAAQNPTLQPILPENEIELHHFKQLSCGSCHQAPTATGDLSNNPDWKSTVDVNRSCTSFGCHNYDDRMNHPLNVPAPAGMPSGSSSELTCLTCHQTAQSTDVGMSDNQDDRILQDPSLVGCYSCHEGMGGSIRQQAHWKFSEKAHLVSLIPGSLNEPEIGAFGSEIDLESETCLGCHDEITVTIPAMNETPREKAERFKNMADHPIGMNYEYIRSREPMYFKSLRGSEDRIRMFDGRVGCGSCHSPYSDIPSNLTAEYEDSVLCLTCHNR